MEEVDKLKTELGEVNEKLRKAQEQAESAKKELENLQSAFGKQGDKFGSALKAAEDKLKELDDLKASQTALLEDIKSLKESGKASGSASQKVESDREKAERLESELTDKERAELKEITEALEGSDDPNDKAELESLSKDDAYWVAVLERVKSRQPASNGVFRSKPKVVPSSDDVAARVQKLMKNERVRNVVADEKGTRGGGYEPPKPSGPKKF